MAKYTTIAQLRNAGLFRSYLEKLNIPLEIDENLIIGEASPFRKTYTLPDGFTIGNRFCIHPMEGWDGTEDGKPSENTFRRWRHFGESGAKLIWGGEAVAVRHDGRANPNQLLINPQNLDSLSNLRQELLNAHQDKYQDVSDLLIGLQLTHSGRFSKPNSKTRMEPRILYHHPVLDAKYGISEDYLVLSDDQIEEIIADMIEAAKMASDIGFHFVDIKHCHGYLGHEFLSAVTRPGRFGGSFENRTRFLRMVVEGIRKVSPTLMVGVRLSVFDFPVFQRHPETGIGIPVKNSSQIFRFCGKGIDEIDLTEAFLFLELLKNLGISLVNVTAGSPYYNPHVQRPALFPPSDGYLPPEDPLMGVARQIKIVARLKQAFPKILFVGSAYSYLQEWLPNVAQHYLQNNDVDFIGLGRMVLSYPEFCADVLAGKPVDRKKLCRTFSDCTTAPRNGMISGCYPIDPFYKDMPEATQLAELKAKSK